MTTTPKGYWKCHAEKLWLAHTSEENSDLFIATNGLVNEVLNRAMFDFSPSLLLPETYNESVLRAFVKGKYKEEISVYENLRGRVVFDECAELLAFLILSAPTKLVDGIWLKSSTLWSASGIDTFVRKLLVSVYNEEISIDCPEENHVRVYTDLLWSIGLIAQGPFSDDLAGVPDEYFAESCVQLALGASPSYFAPEVLGYTLGYEALSSNVLLLRDECRRFGLPDKYFSLHISIDNHHCGHAKVALDAVVAHMKTVPVESRDSVWHRVRVGYALSSIGVGVGDGSVVCDFLIREIERRMGEKGEVGESVHYSAKTRDLAGGIASDRDALWNWLRSVDINYFLNSVCERKMPCVFTRYDKEILLWGKMKTRVRK